MAQVEYIGAKCQHFLFVHQHISAKFQHFFLSSKKGEKVRKYAFLQQSLKGVGEANLISRTRDSVKTYFRLMK